MKYFPTFLKGHDEKASMLVIDFVTVYSVSCFKMFLVVVFCVGQMLHTMIFTISLNQSPIHHNASLKEICKWDEEGGDGMLVA